MKKKVGIIVPVYNSKDYLVETVSSICRQTYQNLEIILVDDGSNDGSSIICDDLKETDERIIVIHIKNGGVSRARNLGIKASNAEYIMPVDSDDIIEETYVEKAVNIMDTYHNMGIVYCKAEKFGDYNGVWNLPEYSLPTMLCNNCIFVTSLFRRRDWLSVGGFCEDMVYGVEDYDFWLSIIELGRDVYCIPETLFYYRIRENSRSIKLDTDIEKTLNMQSNIFNKHRQLYMQNIDAFVQELRKENIKQSLKIRKIYDKIPLYKWLRRQNWIKRFLK